MGKSIILIKLLIDHKGKNSLQKHCKIAEKRRFHEILDHPGKNFTLKIILLRVVDHQEENFALKIILLRVVYHFSLKFREIAIFYYTTRSRNEILLLKVY